MATQYNNISEKLLKLIKWPKDDQGKEVEFVQYRSLRNSSMKVFDADDAKIEMPVYPDVFIPSIDYITDPGAGDNTLTIAHFKAYKQPAPGTIGEPTPNLLPILIDRSNRGIITVPRSEKGGLFRFLELSNCNKDSVNPGKEMPTLGYLIERVKAEATAEEEYDLAMDRLRVAAEVAEMEINELRVLAPKINVDGSQEPKQLRLAVLRAAEANPSFVENHMLGEEGKLVKIVAEAEKLQLIEFVKGEADNPEDSNVWKDYVTRETLVQIAPGIVDTKAALVKFLAGSTAGENLRERLAEMVSAAQKSKRRK